VKKLALRDRRTGHALDDQPDIVTGWRCGLVGGQSQPSGDPLGGMRDIGPVHHQPARRIRGLQVDIELSGR